MRKQKQPVLDMEQHIGYWDRRQWVPWCQYFSSDGNPGSLHEETSQLCSGCLELALEELA